MKTGAVLDCLNSHGGVKRTMSVFSPPKNNLDFSADFILHHYWLQNDLLPPNQAVPRHQTPKNSTLRKLNFCFNQKKNDIKYLIGTADLVWLFNGGS